MSVTSTELYNAYESWCAFYEYRTVSPTEFRRVSKLACPYEDLEYPSTRGKPLVYHGIRLVD
jgi:hypothetical protein